MTTTQQKDPARSDVLRGPAEDKAPAAAGIQSRSSAGPLSASRDGEWNPERCRCYGDAYSGLVSCDYCMDVAR